MQLFTKIATNTLWQIVARIVSSGASFIITIGIARTLGITGYGDLAKITAFVSLFYLIVDLGLNAVFLQMEEHEERFGDLLSFRIALALGLFLLMSVGSVLLPYNPLTGIGYSPLVKMGIVLFSFTFFGRALTLSSSVLFQKRYAYRLGAYATIAGAVITLSFVTLALVFHLPFLFVVGAYTVGSLIEGIISLLLVEKFSFSILIHKTFVKNMMLQTLPIAMMLLLNLVYFRVDMFLLTIMKSTNDVAVYDFAYKFFDFLIALPLFLSNSIYPSLLASGKNTRIAFQKLLLYVAGFAFLGVMVVVPLWFFAPLLSVIKKELAASSFALRILMLSLPIFFATNILQWVFIARKKQFFLAIVYGVFLLINIGLNMVYIPQYSYVASAIITGVSEAGILVALLVYAFVNRV